MEKRTNGQADLVVFCHGGSYSAKGLEKPQSESVWSSLLLEDVWIFFNQCHCLCLQNTHSNILCRSNFVWAYQFCWVTRGKVWSTLSFRSISINPISFSSRTGKISCWRYCWITQFHNLWWSLPNQIITSRGSFSCKFLVYVSFIFNFYWWCFCLLSLHTVSPVVHVHRRV